MKNIVLVGLMGAGKTSVGKSLANELNFEFIDTDELIEKKENSSITETPKASANGSTREISGYPWLVSHFDIALSGTLSFCASCCCVMFFLSLKRLIIAPVTY